jgi:transketolase
MVRKDIIDMVNRAGSGHPGGALSAVEIVSFLYNKILRIDPGNPSMADRDRFVLSKGHAAPVLYSVLSRMGYYDPRLLVSFRKFGSQFQGHPAMEKLSCLDYSGGSLGQGVSYANGIALGLKMDGSTARVYVLVGDGEMQEGQIWEALMTANQYKLDNLTLIVDYNRLQIDGYVDDVMTLQPLDEKLAAFGFQTFQIDGHDVNEIDDAFSAALKVKGKPTAIIAHTIKGKGIPFLENQIACHHRSGGFSEEELKVAYTALGVEV